MAFHGALVGVIIAIALFLKKHPGLTFNVLADEVVVLLPLGIATTRIVNFINDELWGKICHPDEPWCILFPAKPDGYRHPSQIYEMVLDIIATPLMLLLLRRRPADGVVAWAWFTYYGVTRTVAEIWREPGFTVAGLSGGQLVALPMVFAGAILLYIALSGIGTPSSRPDSRRCRSFPAKRSRNSARNARRHRSLIRASREHPPSAKNSSHNGTRLNNRRACRSASRSCRSRRYGGRPAAGSVAILGVTKMQPRDAVLDAVAAGLTDFGENYLQEARDNICRFAAG